MARAVIGTLIAPVLVASPGPCLRIPRVGALTLCHVASTSGANTSIQSLLRESVAARSGKDKPSCNAGGPRRCRTEPAKTNQQRSCAIFGCGQTRRIPVGTVMGHQ